MKIKHFNTVIFILLILNSCKLHKDIFLSSKLPPLSEHDKITVFWFEYFKNDSNLKHVGNVLIKADGIINNSTYNGFVEETEKIAKENGANTIVVIKYIPHILPRFHSYFKAELYFSDSIHNYMSSFKWDLNQKLSWKDFRGTIPDSVLNDSSKAAFSYRYIDFKIISRKIGGFEFNNYFICNTSWVKDSLKNDLSLLHEQVLFNISELYTRKLKEAFYFNNIKKSNCYTKGREVYKSISDELKQFENQFENETNYGKNKAKLYEWYLKTYQML